MALKPDTIIILRCGVPSCPNLGTRPCLGGLSFGRDLRRLGKWEWYCGVLGQRTITPVEDEKPLNPGDGAEPLSGGVQPSKHTGFHKDLNSLPKPLSVSDLSSSRNDGIKVQVAYQGVPGSYSEDAALKAYPNCEVVPCDDFEAALKAVELWLVDKAVLPIENSVGGSIHRNYDLLLRHRLHIVGEVQLEVNHCLLGLPGVRKEDMKLVLSHPQALDQCEKTLNKLGVIRISAEDTADCSFRTCERYWSSGKYSGCSYIWPQCSCRKNAD